MNAIRPCLGSMEHVMERQVSDDMVAYPHRHFNNPVEVLQDNDLTNDEKRRILESWKLDAQRLAESTAENMSGGEESDRREVSKTLLQLDVMKEPPRIVSHGEAVERRRTGITMGLAVGAIIG